MNQVATRLRTRLRQQTRSEIVAVAFDLFARRGFKKVSVEMISAAAGISRATFFNYFPQKELLLREVASARAEKLKNVLGDLEAAGHTPSAEAILQLILKLSQENARITPHSKKLMIETIFHQVSHKTLVTVRDQAVGAIQQFMGAIPGVKKLKAKALAETLLSVYIATMLEWLMRDAVPQKWLVETMRERLQVVLEGVR
ncbi:MAG: TetR family transcriptional regulator [Terracidiphilus sp.]|jgi:AcrR family transcriptional regulator